MGKQLSSFDRFSAWLAQVRAMGRGNTNGNTKPPETQKIWKAPKSLETAVFTEFQAQKKTSVDVFFCGFGGPG
ncbi:hypothetical protein QN399_20065 [Pseudomonas sp. 10C3]|nr:hypothetical protein [Pseudomonas sp. 10C3]MEE3508518.1 hypothetical protein [Pseudomonas sp. 10C3]